AVPKDAPLLGLARDALEVSSGRARGGGNGAPGVEGMPVRALVRLPGAELALDDDDVEEGAEAVSLDLVALLARITVGDQPQPGAGGPEVLEGGAGIGEEGHGLAAALRVILGHAHGERGGGAGAGSGGPEGELLA